MYCWLMLRISWNVKEFKWMHCLMNGLLKMFKICLWIGGIEEFKIWMVPSWRFIAVEDHGSLQNAHILKKIMVLYKIHIYLKKIMVIYKIPMLWRRSWFSIKSPGFKEDNGSLQDPHVLTKIMPFERRLWFCIRSIFIWRK